MLWDLNEGKKESGDFPCTSYNGSMTSSLLSICF